MTVRKAVSYCYLTIFINYDFMEHGGDNFSVQLFNSMVC